MRGCLAFYIRTIAHILAQNWCETKQTVDVAHARLSRANDHNDVADVDITSILVLAVFTVNDHGPESAPIGRSLPYPHHPMRAIVCARAAHYWQIKSGAILIRSLLDFKIWFLISTNWDYGAVAAWLCYTWIFHIMVSDAVMMIYDWDGNICVPLIYLCVHL